METLDDIYDEMTEAGAELFAINGSFENGADACTIVTSGGCGVFFDLRRISTLKKERTAAVHERSHIKTGAFYRVGARPECVAYWENKARIRSIKDALPFEEIRSAMREGYISIPDLADYFDFTEEFIEEALRYYVEDRGLSFNM